MRGMRRRVILSALVGPWAMVLGSVSGRGPTSVLGDGSSLDARAGVTASGSANVEYPDEYVGGALVRLNDNGAWSWFMDPRAIIDEGKLIAGSVRAVGSNQANESDPRWGNVEVSVYELATGRVATTVLHPHLEQDDHDAPAFLIRRDGSYLAVYSKHAVERRMYYRISEPHNPLAWGPAAVIETPGENAARAGNNDTYANLFRMPDGRVFNFFRGFGHDYDNSLYHGYLQGDTIHHSNGAVVGTLNTTTEKKIATWELTKVFQGTPDDVAWMADIELDRDAHPYVLFSTQIDGRGLPRGQGGMDLRYHYARWDGTSWHTEEIAQAGRRLYAGEDDYSGLGALDPKNPDVMYISTDADPVSGDPLVSHADRKRHYELFRGQRDARLGKWTWAPFTRNSTADNLRPVIPAWNDPRTALVWMRGTYVHNHGEWTTSMVAVIIPPLAPAGR